MQESPRTLVVGVCQYYVATVVQSGSTSYIKGTTYTTKDDFPLSDIEYYIAKYHKKFIQNIAITFYKEITESNYKSYNNE